MPEKENKEFVFTFGSGQKYGGCYVLVYAPDSERARLAMVENYGTEWGFQYSSEQEAGVKKYNLQLIDRLYYQGDQEHKEHLERLERLEHKEHNQEHKTEHQEHNQGNEEHREHEEHQKEPKQAQYRLLHVFKDITEQEKADFLSVVSSIGLGMALNESIFTETETEEAAIVEEFIRSTFEDGPDMAAARFSANFDTFCNLSSPGLVHKDDYFLDLPGEKTEVAFERYEETYLLVLQHKTRLLYLAKMIPSYEGTPPIEVFMKERFNRIQKGNFRELRIAWEQFQPGQLMPLCDSFIDSLNEAWGSGAYNRFVSYLNSHCEEF